MDAQLCQSECHHAVCWLLRLGVIRSVSAAIGLVLLISPGYSLVWLSPVHNAGPPCNALDSACS